ncbi:MAG: hypothetical protein QFX35_05845, partial [Candidatus Verstraetearchaeota archaeon]|nr:hypothetical protein [Candidatus Verstraetearchaeota archaeon]
MSQQTNSGIGIKKPRKAGERRTSLRSTQGASCVTPALSAGVLHAGKDLVDEGDKATYCEA